MITAVEIENFKAIGEPVRINIKPITLLFGPNSSGKSTVLQALQYLRHLVLYETADVDRTDQVTGTMDLGGFRRLVHQHDLDRAIRIRIEHSRRTWWDLCLWEHFIEPHFETSDEILVAESILKDLLESIGMEIEVKWSHVKGAPYIAAYRVFINGEQATEITGDPDKNFHLLKKVSFEAAFDRALKEQDADDSLRGIVGQIDQHCADAEMHPDVHQLIGLFSNPHRRIIPDPQALGIDWLVPFSSQSEYMGKAYSREIFHLLSALVIGPAYLTSRELGAMCYIGPIRDIPPLHLHEIVSDRDISWDRGMAGWNRLFKGGRDFVEHVSQWLSRPDRLNMGYGVKVQDVVELMDDVLVARILEGADYSVLDDLRRKLRQPSTRKRIVFVEEGTGLELPPSQLGTGLSQIVPVVVATLDPNRTFVAVEQPELHVHPAVQVGLGDLLIQGISSDFDEEGEQAFNAPPIFLIETHSEHLMLRLLRRIRETSEGELPPDARGLTPEEVSVNYCEHDRDGGSVRIVPLRIDEAGEFGDEWPKGFFEERAEELF